MIFSILFYFFIILSIICILVLKKQNIKIELKLFTKIFGYTLLGAVLIKVWAADGFLRIINGGRIYQTTDYVTVHDFGESFVRIITMVLECMFLSLIISNNKRVKWILTFIGLPLFAFVAVRFPWSVQYFLEPIKFKGLYFVNEYGAALLLIVEYVALFLGLLFNTFFDDFKINKEDVLPTLKIGIFSLFACIPFYVFASIFGTTDFELKSFNLIHIIWIIAIPLVYILILILFKKEDEKTRFSVLAILVFYMVIHTSTFARAGYRSDRFPINPCNIAPYVELVILLTKNRRLFNCQMIANPAGALVGIIVTDTGRIFNFWMSHFIIEHTYAFLLPLLLIQLGFMERDKFKSIVKDFFICTAIYTGACLLIDCIHNGIVVGLVNNKYIDNVNFFFLIESPLEVGFLPLLQSFGFKLFGQMIYPLYILFIFTAFSIISFLLYFIGKGLRKISAVLNKSKA